MQLKVLGSILGIWALFAALTMLGGVKLASQSDGQFEALVDTLKVYGARVDSLQQRVTALENQRTSLELEVSGTRWESANPLPLAWGVSYIKTPQGWLLNNNGRFINFGDAEHAWLPHWVQINQPATGDACIYRSKIPGGWLIIQKTDVVQIQDPESKW